MNIRYWVGAPAYASAGTPQRALPALWQYFICNRLSRPHDASQIIAPVASPAGQSSRIIGGAHLPRPRHSKTKLCSISVSTSRWPGCARK